MWKITKEEIAEFGKQCNHIANSLYDAGKKEDSKKVHEFKNSIYELFDRSTR